MLAGVCVAAAFQGCGSGLGAGFFNAAASSASANQAVAAAQLGYAWNATDRTLRPIVGVAGSSRVAASVVPAQTYAAGASSAVSSTAVLVRADGSVDRVSLPAGTATTVAGAVAASGSRIRFSPSGAYAVIFAPGGTSGTLLKQVSTSPQVTAFRSSSALIDAAVSDQGTLAVLQKQGAGAQLALITAGGAVQAVSTLSGTGALSFLTRRDDVLVVDAGANALTIVRSVSSAPATTQIATANLLETPIAVGASFDSRWVVVANGADSNVVRIDLNGTTTPQRIACPVQPTTVDQLAGNASFRFTEIGRAPAWLSDISAQEPAMLFVPALAGS